MMPMERPDYMEAIYRNRTRNRINLSTPTVYNLPAAAFAALPPSFVAQPFLRTLGDNVLVSNDQKEKEFIEDGNAGGVLQRLLRAQRLGKCSPSSMILSCGAKNDWCGSGGTDCKIRYKPVSGMDRVAFSDGNEHLLSTEIDQARGRPLTISQVDAQGSNNAFLSRYSQFIFENEKQRLLSQYNIGAPPFPKPCPGTAMGTVPRYDAATNIGAPIYIPESVFEQKNNCGCNNERIAEIYSFGK